MHSECYQNRNLTALTVKGEPELAARVPFERKELNSSAWESYALCICNRSEINVPWHGARQQSVPSDGTLTNVGVCGDYGARSNLGLSACAHHEQWLFPVIGLNVSRNATAAVKILLEPHKLFQHSAANVPGTTLDTEDRP